MNANRRHFLQFLAASTVIAPATRAWAQQPAFGQEGIERVLDILRAELTLTMRQMGTPSIRDITPGRVLRA